MTITTFEQLGELYVGTLVSDAYFKGAAGTVADAVLEALTGDTGDNTRRGCLDAAARLTRDAMGFLEHTVGLIDQDWLAGRCDWARIDQCWGQPLNAVEQRWLHEQLSEQADRAWNTYRRYLPDGEEHNGGIHLDWIHDLALAATFLQAAAMLVADAFNIDTEAA